MTGSQSNNNNRYVKLMRLMIEKKGFSVQFEKDEFFFIGENDERISPTGYINMWKC